MQIIRPIWSISPNVDVILVIASTTLGSHKKRKNPRTKIYTRDFINFNDGCDGILVHKLVCP